MARDRPPPWLWGRPGLLRCPGWRGARAPCGVPERGGATGWNSPTSEGLRQDARSVWRPETVSGRPPPRGGFGGRGLCGTQSMALTIITDAGARGSHITPGHCANVLCTRAPSACPNKPLRQAVLTPRVPRRGMRPRGHQAAQLGCGRAGSQPASLAPEPCSASLLSHPPQHGAWHRWPEAPGQ